MNGKSWLMAGVTLLALPAMAQAATPRAEAAETISATRHMSTLDIAPGKSLVAPFGKSLTLTVDGVERPIEPGHYAGNVVLTVSDAITVQYHDLPAHAFRAALYVDGDQPVAAKSVTAAVVGGRVSRGLATDIHITSQGPRFNGVLVTGSGTYRLERPVLDLTGNGGNDFAGFGAAIMATDHANVIVNRPIIRTHGAIRPALFVGGDATLHLDGADIEVRNGTLPSDYKFTVDIGKMMEVPWMLGLSGNVRASNLVGRGTLFITNSHIKAQGWGALSTDEPDHIRMFVKDSLIETVDSGYGTYAIGDTKVVFDHSRIRAADIGAVMAAEGSVTLTNGTSVTSRRFGVLVHSRDGGGTLLLDKGSSIRSAETAILVKGVATNIQVDHGTLAAGNHVLLQSMENDDPFMKAVINGRMPEGVTALPPGMTLGEGGGDPKGPVQTIAATFRDTRLSGDVFHGRERRSAMSLSFAASEITGQISTSHVAPARGADPTRATYREIGRVVNTPAPATAGRSLRVSLDARSHWRVTGTSYLTELSLARGSRIDAGTHRLAMIIDGKPVAIRPGTYTGAISLRVGGALPSKR